MATEQEIEARDRAWLRDVYRGDREAQLTPRAVAIGMVTGSVMSLSNIYSGLKIGWSFGASLTSAILAFALFAALRRIPRWAGLAGCAALAIALLGVLFTGHGVTDLASSRTIALGIPALVFVTLAVGFAVGAFEQRLTLLENNSVQTAASAAGYMSSAGLLSAIPALALLSRPGADGSPAVIEYPRALTPIALTLWLAAVSYLGVVAAVPVKRQMINNDQLAFPSGTACAVTLRGMHAESGAGRRASGLLVGALLGVLVKCATGLRGLIPTIRETFYLAPQWHFLRRAGAPGGVSFANLTIGLPVSLLLLGGGALIGLRVALSLAAGAVVNYLVVAPILHTHGIIDASRGYPAIRAWSLWPGTALMVTSALTSFALRWRTLIRAFAGLGRLFGAKRDTVDVLAHTEVPDSWFAVGIVLAGGACVALQWWLFGIRPWMGVLAALASLTLALVSARVVGETDVNPTGALGKITQLLYGVIAPTDVTTNLMTANVTAGAASHAADLLTDMKTGYLLGANARKQFIAQLFGVVAGAAVSVPVYQLVARPGVLGSRDLPAPAAVAWAAVARLFRQGVHGLPPGALTALFVFAVIGSGIAVLEHVRPTWRRFLPSATGLGIAFYIAASDSLALALGAVIAWAIRRAVRTESDAGEDEERGLAADIVPVSSGMIAGESLMGIVVAALGALGITGGP